MMQWWYVFIGGGAGSLCRYAIARLLVPLQTTFPWATLAANALSCLLLGFLLGLSIRQTVGHEYRLLLMSGFCGGFSTFSTFTSETFVLFQTGHPGLALLNIGISILVCLLFLYLGTRLA